MELGRTVFFEHESNVFGTRMDTDEHGFYRAEDYIIYSPTDVTDEHRFGIFKVALTKTIKTPNSIFR